MMDICLFFLHAYLTPFIFAGSKIVISSLIFNKQIELLLLFHLSLIIPVCFSLPVHLHCLTPFLLLEYSVLVAYRPEFWWSPRHRINFQCFMYLIMVFPLPGELFLTIFGSITYVKIQTSLFA